MNKISLQNVTIILFVLKVFVPFVLNGQVPFQINPSPFQNYIVITTIEKVGTTNVSQVSSLNADGKSVQVMYYDGLGRPVQQVDWASSPDAYKDMVQPMAYDESGRESFKYLPYVGNGNAPSSMDGSYKPSALKGGTQDNYMGSEQKAFYMSLKNDGFPYAETVYEASPLDRVLEQGAPGSTWQPNKVAPSNGRTVKLVYRSNVANEVRKFTYDYTTSNVSVAGHYSANELYVTETRDENGIPTSEYTDKVGRVVLKKTGTGALEAMTYYINDDFNNLRMVIQPEGSVNLPSSGALSMSFKDNWCYQYNYDSRQRMIEKKVPGSGWEHFFYDKRDRLVLSQDARQRAGAEYNFIKYDNKNRPVATGIYRPRTSSGAKEHPNREQMQVRINGLQSNNCDVLLINEKVLQGDEIVRDAFDGYQEYKASISVVLKPGFSFIASGNGSFKASIAPSASMPEDGGFPLGQYCEYLTVTYYDHYGFDFANEPNYSLIAELGISAVRNNRVTGLVTGTKTKVLDGGQWLRAINYYDDRYRLSQSISDNHVSGRDRYSYKYRGGDNIDRFSDKVYETRHTLMGHGGPVSTIHESFTYDQAGRPLEHRHKVNNNGQEVLLSSNTYNAIGELVTKEHEKGNSTLQKTDYRYNIRGWLKTINGGALNVPENDLFAMELYYDEANYGQPGQYNGNISGQAWQVKGSQGRKGHAYLYDGLNRLSRASYYEGSGYVTNGYHEEILHPTDPSLSGYDLNGNILGLKRWDHTGLIDNLGYTYNNNNRNSLVRVHDATGNPAGYNNASTNSTAYNYDVNGNMIRDLNKNIDISYNFLNLPMEIRDRSNSDRWIRYTYSSTGAKLRKEVRNGNNTTIRDYVGALELEDNDLTLVHTAEGVMTKDLKYQYFLKDHLGNVRVVAERGSNGQAYVVQETEYYPFGMIARSTDTENKYLYNGNEFQNELGLDLYDFNARYYDPAIGRFLNIDELAEAAYELTPYRFGFNNPIRFNDPDGLWEEDKNGNMVTRDRDEIARFMTMLELEGDRSGSASKSTIDNFIAGELAGEGGKLSDGTAVLTGLTVVNGSPTGYSLLRTNNEMALHLELTDYVYNDADIKKRNEMFSNPDTRWVANQILRNESKGYYQPITATNYINHSGGEVTARLKTYKAYNEMMDATQKPAFHQGKGRYRNTSPGSNGGGRGAGSAASTMSFKEYRAAYGHHYRGKYEGRGTYLKKMAQDWKAGKTW